MQRLPVLLAQASGAAAEELGAIEAEVAQLSQWLLCKFMADEISPTDFHSAEARLAHIGTIIQKKRRSASLAPLSILPVLAIYRRFGECSRSTVSAAR